MTAPRAAKRSTNVARLEPSVSPHERLLGGALFVTVLATYLLTASPYLGGGDNAEFVTIFARGGVAHPSGYPLYCVLLRLLSWMPGGPALGSARATAIIGAVSVIALYRACRAWGGSVAGAFVASGAYALSSLAWRLATEAEVFALEALFAAILLYLTAPRSGLTPERRAVALAGAAGLALTDHLTIVLLAPVGIYATVQALRAVASPLKTVTLAVLAFGAGLSPYLYSYAVGRAPHGAYVWGDPGTWGGLWRHVTRADYGTFQLMASGAPADPGAGVGRFFEQTASHALGLPLVIGVFGFAWAYRLARPEHPSRGEVLALAATWASAGPLFALALSGPPDALGATLVERFRLLPEVVLTIGVAWGLDAWPRFAQGRLFPFAVATLAMVAPCALHAWPEVRADHSDALELYTENTLASAPPRAVLLGTGDYRLFSFLYAETIGLRPDVAYVDPHLLGYEWYKRRAGRALGAEVVPPDPSGDETVTIAEQAMTLGRPVFVTDVFDPAVVNAFASYPLGTLIRLLPHGTSPPLPEAVDQENAAVFSAFRRWDPVARDDAWAKAVLPAYPRPWIALARIFERHGDAARAKRDRERAAEWGGER